MAKKGDFPLSNIELPGQLNVNRLSIKIKELDPEVLGDRIKFLRRTKLISQQELAKDLCSASYLSLIETGRIHPNVTTLYILSERLGEPLEYFTKPTPSQKAINFKKTILAEKFHSLAIKQHLLLVEISLANGELDKAERELDTVREDISLLGLETRVFYSLLKADLRIKQFNAEQALLELEGISFIQLQRQAWLSYDKINLYFRFEFHSGQAFMLNTNYFKALEHFRLALKILDRLKPGTIVKGFETVDKNNSTYIQLHQMQSELLQEAEKASKLLGDYEQAGFFLEQYFELFDPHKEKKVFQNLLKQAEENSCRGNFHEASLLLSRGFDLIHLESELIKRFDLTLRESQLNWQLKRFDRSKHFALMAEAIFSSLDQASQIHLQNYKFSVLVIFSQISFEEGKLQETRLYLTQAEELLDRAANIEVVEKIRFFQTAGRVFNRQRQAEAAAEYYKKAVTLIDSLDSLKKTIGDKNHTFFQQLFSEIFLEYSELLKGAGKLIETIDTLEKAYILLFT